MSASLEVWRDNRRESVTLLRDRLTIGKAATNDLAFRGDATVSRLHAVLERYPAGWSIRDVNSRNGTFVNQERLWRERPLYDGDQITIGTTRIRFSNPSDEPDSRTEAAEAAPALTARERDVLLALCSPLLRGDLFTEPASLRDVATALHVSEAAVKQHMARLYNKFGVHGDGGRRRVRLANDAVRRGSVSVADLVD